MAIKRTFLFLFNLDKEYECNSACMWANVTEINKMKRMRIDKGISNFLNTPLDFKERFNYLIDYFKWIKLSEYRKEWINVNDESKQRVLFIEE